MARRSDTPWGKLTDRGRDRLRKTGVTPQAYNAWEKKTPAQKRDAGKKGVSRSDFIRGQTPKQQKRQARTTAARDTRNEKRQAVIQHVSDLTGGRANPKAVGKWIIGMEGDELDDLLDMDYDDLLDAAADSDDPGHRYHRLYKG